jgi:outer membrane protein insertion porin family
MDPYYTIDGVSRGFDVYKRDTDASSLAIGAYGTKTLGGGIKFGFPISETDSFSLGFNGEDVALTTYSTSPLTYLKFVDTFGSQYTYGAVTAGWTHDTRDSLIVTNKGILMRASSEVAGGDLEYFRVGYQHQWYQPLSRTYTLALGGELGYAGGIGSKPLPFFKNYYVGGPGSVRGYRSFSIGPQSPSGERLGGNRKVIVNGEVLFPMPGAGQDRSLRLAWFVDGGQVYSEDQAVALRDLRYAAGIALAWNSPVGPLRLSYGRPLNDKPGDSIERLQFTFGTMF